MNTLSSRVSFSLNRYEGKKQVFMFWVTQAEEEVGLGRRIADSVQEGSPEYSSDYNAATDYEKTHRIRKSLSPVSHSIPAVPDSISRHRLSAKPKNQSFLVLHVI